MSFTFVNIPEVRVDLLNAVDYYKSIDTKLAEQFLFRVKEAKAYITASPLGFQVKYNQVRTILIKQFPYHIHYFIDYHKKQIVILAIIHAYKNPTDYSNRM